MNSERPKRHSHHSTPTDQIYPTSVKHTKSQNNGRNNNKFIVKHRISSTQMPMVEIQEEKETESKNSQDFRVPTISHDVEKTNQDKAKTSSRSIKDGNHNEKFVYYNHGFRMTKEDELMENENFTRMASEENSLQSSIRDSSVRSLSVIREQYWCFAKWTPCERILAGTVGILAIIIVLLVIVIGFISKNTSARFSDQFNLNL